jgi:hypothetical protein
MSSSASFFTTLPGMGAVTSLLKAAEQRQMAVLQVGPPTPVQLGPSNPIPQFSAPVERLLIVELNGMGAADQKTWADWIDKALPQESNMHVVFIDSSWPQGVANYTELSTRCTQFGPEYTDKQLSQMIGADTAFAEKLSNRLQARSGTGKVEHPVTPDGVGRVLAIDEVPMTTGERDALLSEVEKTFQREAAFNATIRRPGQR